MPTRGWVFLTCVITSSALPYLALLAASVVRELRMPKEQRTWHGVVFGKVPYDLRLPTPELPFDKRALVRAHDVLDSLGVFLLAEKAR